MRPTSVLLFCIFLLLWAQAAALSLGEALAQADARAEVVASALNLQDAERALGRAEADPLALRPDLLQAEQARTLARVRLEQARYNAYVEIAESYTDAREAEAQRALAAQGRDLAAQALNIARIRAERGGVTPLEVRDAEARLDDAQQAVNAGTETLRLARSRLASLTGLSPEQLEPVTELLPTEPPPIEVFYDQLERNPLLLEPVQGLELAELGVYLLDPSFAAQAQLDAARFRVEQAEEIVKETRRGLSLQVNTLYVQVQTAADALRLAREALENSLERETVEQQRLDAGLIAEISFRQTQLETAEARLEVLEREHAYLLSLLRLQAATLVAIEGLHGF